MHFVKRNRNRILSYNNRTEDSTRTFALRFLPLFAGIGDGFVVDNTDDLGIVGGICELGLRTNKDI